VRRSLATGPAPQREVVAGLHHAGDQQWRAEGDLLDGAGDEPVDRADGVAGGVGDRRGPAAEVLRAAAVPTVAVALGVLLLVTQR
jgi:hypothetical protein